VNIQQRRPHCSLPGRVVLSVDAIVEIAGRHVRHTFLRGTLQRRSPVLFPSVSPERISKAGLKDDLWFFFSKSERTGFHLVLGGCCFLLYWIFGTKCQGLPFKIRSKFLAFPGISNFSPCICFQDMNFRPGQHRFASSFDVQLVLRYFLLRQVSRVHDRTTPKT